MSVPKKLFRLGLDATRVVVNPVADFITLGGSLSDRDPFGPTYTGEALRDTRESLELLRRELGKEDR